MMRWIVGSSLRFRLLVLPVAAALFLGVVPLREAPVDVLPEFTPPMVQVHTEALGLSAHEVEQLITVPLEADLLNGVAWLDEIRSESVSGLSSVELIFEPGTNVLRARQMVQERLTQAHALPNVSKAPVMLQPLSSTSRVMMIGLSSTELSLIELSVLARWKIRPRLTGVQGVANVAIWGQRERQLQVQVDPARLRARGVSLNQVVKTTGNALWVSPLTFVEASTPGTGGFIDSPNQRLSIQHILPIRTPQDLSQVRVEDTGEARLRLGDVAAVVQDHQPLIGDVVGGENPQLMLVVEKFPGADTLEVTRDIEAAFDALRPGLKGVDVDTTVFRPASFVEQALDNLAGTLLVALLLMVGLLMLFGWRAALVCLVTVPLSLLAAALVLHVRGASFNTVVLAGLVLAVGVVIDDAVVDVDQLRRRLRQADPETPSAATAVSAALEIRGPLLPASLIVLATVAPAFFISGVIGAFSRPLALSYVLAVAASMAVALFVTPALASVLLPTRSARRAETPFARWLRGRYTAVAGLALRRPLRTLFAAAVVALAGVAAIPQLSGAAMLPSLQDRDVLIHWNASPGTSRQEMDRITGHVVRELRDLDGVRSVGAHVGRAITSDQVAGVNTGEIWTSLDPDANYGSTTAAIQRVVDGYPGIDRDVLTYPEERVRAALTGSDSDLVVRLYGQDLGVLADRAEKVRAALTRIDGARNPHVNTEADEPTVEIEVDLAAAERHGLKPGDVRRAAAALLSGIEVGNLFEDQKVFEVVVWGTPAIRTSVTSIHELLIDTPRGGHVRLKDVADVRIAPSPTVIRHHATARYVDVGVNVRGRDVAGVVEKVEQAVEGIDLPVEYHAELIGQYGEGTDDQEPLIVAGFAAAVAILLLLQAAFGSWRLAAAVLLTLPVALAGAVVAAFAGGDAISLWSLLAFVTVLGIAVRNSVLMIRQLQGAEPSGLDAVLREAGERVVPIMATALATAAVLAPVALVGGVAGQEALHPIALVILGGLVTSTLFSLFVVPALYLALGSPADAPRTEADAPRREANAPRPEGEP
jgi:CzcA family heavy metal efflux pump